MRGQTVLLAGLIALALGAARETTAAAGSRQDGKRPVGFRVIAGRDERRPMDGEGRPVQIAVWYPAPASGARPMTYRDYVALTASELHPEKATDAERRGAVGEFEKFLASAHVSKPDAARILATRMSAVAGAPSAAERSPLVLLAPGDGQSAHDQAFLAEYLASQGYVVAATPSAARISGPMKSEEDIPAKAEEQAADLAFAAARLRASGLADAGSAGVVGHSFGARAALLFAMGEPSVAALVSLDGGIGAKTGRGYLERSSRFDARGFQAPILHFYEDADAFMAPDFALLESLAGSRRLLVRVPDLHHIHFTSVGALAAEAPSLAAATSAGAGTRASFEAVCRAAVSFLDATVKDSPAGEKAWRPSDPKLADIEVLEDSRRGRWIAGPQGRLRVDEAGSGGRISVFFVHGNGGNRTQWAAQLEHLRATRRAAALDLRGMGESESARNGDYSVTGFAEDVAAAADARKLERFVLVGHSFGGAVVAAYAGRHPGRLAGLVFADVAGDLRSTPPAQLASLLKNLEPATYEGFTQRWFEAILTKGKDSTKEQVFRSLRATPREVFVGATSGLYDFDTAAALAPYRGPRLHIASFLADNPQAIHRGFPDIPVRVVGDASHWLMMDQPDEFNRFLDEFLAGLN